MQFKYATLAVMATAVIATGFEESPDSTVYYTEEVTITSCAPTITVSSSPISPSKPQIES